MLKFFARFLPQNSRQYREETSQRIAWGHWFALFNIVLALLISSRYAFNADWPNTLFGKLYFFISLFGHFSFVVFAVFLLLLFPLSFLIKNERTFRGVSVIIATIGLTVLLVDTEVFKQFYLHLSPLVWDLLVNPDNGELSRQWQVLFVPMPLILLAEMLYSRWCWQKLRSFNRQKWGKFVALFFLTCFTATHLLYAWADMSLYRPITAQKANYPLSYPMTARSFLEKHGLIDKTAMEQQLKGTGQLDAFYLNYPKKPLNATKQSTANVLFINFSGLKNEWINPQNTPNLDKISRQSYHFMQHYSSGEDEMAGVVGLFYSLSGKYVDSILSERKSSPLIDLLQQSGYQFGLFSHSNFEEPIYRRSLFRNFDLPKSSNNLEAINLWKSWLVARSAQPFFSYLDLTLPPANDKEQQAKLLDWQFGQIWQQLEQQGLTHNTLVLITADLGEKNDKANRFDRSRLEVPMIAYWQGDSLERTELSSHLDIMPTLVSQFFGVNNPLADYAQGQDLTKPTQRMWVLAGNRKSDVAIMADNEQYHIDKNGHFQSYNAEGEQQNNPRPPLAVFLQLIKQSNQFVEK
ncbi:hypothetical protein B0187_06185 [Haemophilus paracuniculus]|uniref:DUF3413 domain-containing protein n=1 Tax=Haemophilus paracuniculus TaxID=734 RepID=A0A1T0AS69_9PAST|nr:DUF3413 domain-containing protein [Haemophilus paracuniculus]OOR99342.1 hypothetical protein B0187_06185 [Haemophilus paracuniculus]